LLSVQTFCSSTELRARSFLFVRQNSLRNCAARLLYTLVPPLHSPSFQWTYSESLALLTIYSIVRSPALSAPALVPISRNYSFDQTKSVHDAPSRSRITHTSPRFVYSHACTPLRSYIAHVYYVVAGATARCGSGYLARH